MSIAIIGGGASGLILASKLKNKNVTILEKNSKLGKKLLLTGNGKCNFTSGDFDNLHEIYNNDFAINLYKLYDNKSFISFFRSIGIEPKLIMHRDKKYYYPMTNKATSVYYNLLDKVISNGTKIIYDEEITEVKKNSDRFILKTKKNNEYTFDKVVFATGGMSYKNTGSDGFGYKIVESFGHSIVSLNAGLVQFKISDEYKSIKNLRVDAVVLYNNFKELGEVQFTEGIISGIPILNLSRIIRSDKFPDKTYITLNFAYDFTDINSLIDYLHSRRENISYKKSRDFLCGFLPDELACFILKISNIDFDKRVININDKEIDCIANYICNFKVKIISKLGFDSAQITLGGVSVDEIDNTTLMSKKVNNLYFVGEIIDIDGKCGGYNLQMCYSTAMAVANNI